MAGEAAGGTYRAHASVDVDAAEPTTAADAGSPHTATRLCATISLINPFGTDRTRLVAHRALPGAPGRRPPPSARASLPCPPSGRVEACEVFGQWHERCPQLDGAVDRKTAKSPQGAELAHVEHEAARRAERRVDPRVGRGAREAPTCSRFDAVSDGAGELLPDWRRHNAIHIEAEHPCQAGCPDRWPKSAGWLD